VNRIWIRVSLETNNATKVLHTRAAFRYTSAGNFPALSSADVSACKMGQGFLLLYPEHLVLCDELSRSAAPMGIPYRLQNNFGGLLERCTEAFMDQAFNTEGRYFWYCCGNKRRVGINIRTGAKRLGGLHRKQCQTRSTFPSPKLQRV
jgi:hypothetical protein